MFKLFWLFVGGFFISGDLCSQEAPKPQLSIQLKPEIKSLWYYPERMNGNRGARMDFFELKIVANGSISGKGTMTGFGTNGCRINGTNMAGKLEGNILTLETVPEGGEAIPTCHLRYSILLKEDGSYASATYESVVPGRTKGVLKEN